MRRIGAAAGIIGPLFFGVVVLMLTLIEYRFLLSIGWDPVAKPTYNWPSGISLGPLGWIMVVAFLLSGVLMSAFGLGLRTELGDKPGRFGAALIAGAGTAMMGLAFSTDPTTIPVTWHGRLHDLSFLLLGLLLIPGMLLCGLSFRRRAVWKGFSGFTWFTAALAVPTFAIKGVVFYAFLLAMLAWNEAVAIHLWKRG